MGSPMGSEFGSLLRVLRKSAGETLEQVAQSTGLSIAMLSRMERGERLPSPDSVAVLAAHFGVPEEELLGAAAANRLENRYGQRGADRAAERIIGRSMARGGYPLDAPEERAYGAFRARPIGELFASPARRSSHVARAEHVDAAPPPPASMASVANVSVRADLHEQGPYSGAAEEAAEAVEVATRAALHARRKIAQAIGDDDTEGMLDLIRALEELGALAVFELARIRDGASGERVRLEAERALGHLDHFR